MTFRRALMDVADELLRHHADAAAETIDGM